MRSAEVVAQGLVWLADYDQRWCGPGCDGERHLRMHRQQMTSRSFQTETWRQTSTGTRLTIGSREVTVRAESSQCFLNEEPVMVV
jgi:hypothetical protein